MHLGVDSSLVRYDGNRSCICGEDKGEGKVSEVELAVFSRFRQVKY